MRNGNALFLYIFGAIFDLSVQKWLILHRKMTDLEKEVVISYNKVVRKFSKGEFL